MRCNKVRTGQRSIEPPELIADSPIDGSSHAFYRASFNDHSTSAYDSTANSNLFNESAENGIFHVFFFTTENITVVGGGAGPPAPPRGRGRGPMTREEAQRLREEELAGQGHGKDCFIIPQANLDRFLPDGVTVSILSCIHNNNFFPISKDIA